MRIKAAACGLVAVLVAFGQLGQPGDLKALFAARDWSGLQRALDKSNPSSFLYRGALAIAFNQDSNLSERWLRAAIRSAPQSDAAYEAYEQLLHLYLRTGQYRHLASVLDERWAAFPERIRDRQQEQASLAAFRGLPDQSIERFQRSTVTHESDSIYIPISVNGHPVSFFFDTGAWFSVVSESEARRLGLAMSGASSTTHTMTADASFRMAVANEVQIGSMRLRNVSFGVFPDTREPFAKLPPGRQGAIGIPLILSFRTLRWVKRGGLEIGQPAGPFDLAKSNLYFDDDHLVIASTFESRKVLATLDTGAKTTDLMSGFAKQFPRFLQASGKEDTREIRGLGGAVTYHAVTVPHISFRIGNVETSLRPAQVVTNDAGAKCCVGNFGMDLLRQGRAFKIDFGAMKLELQSN